MIYYKSLLHKSEKKLKQMKLERKLSEIEMTELFNLFSH